jgi:3-oxoadipate enol-lactonase/4-carboxymuconolactone decarboxylase
MPFTTTNNTRIYYRLEGSGDRPLLVLAHALGLDHGMWDPQVPALLAGVYSDFGRDTGK